MATLHGRCVESSTLSPIPGVNVNAGSGSSITDGNGEFTINVYPGTIRLVASAYGYAGYSQMLSIPGEGSFEVGAPAAAGDEGERPLMSLRTLKREMLPGLLNIPGVRGVGGSEEQGKFRVYVQGSPGFEVIPEVIGGYTVEIHHIGKVKALSMLEMMPLATGSERQQSWRPAPGGVSAGHNSVTAGTFGMVINKDGHLYGLGNNHVFANSDRIGHVTARLYDPILQPAIFDGGADPNDRLGTLHSWRPLDEAVHNHADWALLDPTSQDSLSTEILGVGQPAGFKQAEVGMNVIKSGRTSAVTSGTITDVGADLIVDYEGFSCVFMDQIMTTYMADGGDSGSVLIDPSDNMVVGLCFSGSNLVTLSNHIGLVMNDIMATGIGPAAVSSFSWAPVMIVLAGLGIALIFR